MSDLLQTSPTILLVEPDDQVRPTLKQSLQRWGYRVIVALDNEDAVERVKPDGMQIDAILINQLEHTIEQLIDIGQFIRQTSKSTHSCIVILADRYGSDLEGHDVQLGEREYVTYLEDGQQLKDLLYRLCPP